MTRLDQRGAAGLGGPSRTNVRYLIRLRAHCTPSLTAALCQASVAERRARAPASNGSTDDHYLQTVPLLRS